MVLLKAVHLVCRASDTLTLVASSMDHIPTPSDDHTHDPFEVPYFGHNSFRYDDLGMVAYPQRVNIDDKLLALDREPRLPLRSAGSFVQAWLWFGLVGEYFRVGSRDTPNSRRVSFESFIKTVSGKEYISLSQLDNVRSTEQKDGISECFIQWRNPRLLSCVHVAHSFVAKAINTLGPLEVPHKDECSLAEIYLVLLSVQILSQTLLELLQRYSRPLATLESSLNAQSTHLVDLILRQVGWLPPNIHRLPRDITLRYYLANFKTFALGEIQQSIAGVSGNTLGLCLSSSECRPLHVDSGCHCPERTIKTSSIRSMLSETTIPVCTYQQEGSQGMCLKMRQQVLDGNHMLESNPGPPLPFVAISHVRSRGLGNDVLNSLPHCQLCLVQTLVDQILPPKKANEHTSFWIDTFCVSINPKFRKAEKCSIWKAFRTASAVLVLDPSLSSHVFTSPEEALIRIRYSLWKQRLWTLEEGYFARKLIFRFANGLVSLDELLDGFRPYPPFNAILPFNVPPEWREMMDTAVMTQSLLSFASDIHLASAVGSDIDKTQLYRILRIGYLSSRKFLLFLEEDEVVILTQVWPQLLQVYGQAPLNPDDPSAAHRRLEMISTQLKEFTL